MATPDLKDLDLDDTQDTADLFASPSRTTSNSTTKILAAQDPVTPAQHPSEARYDAEQAREAALQRELEGLRSINTLLENVVGSLECAKGNMDVVSNTVSSASTLLNTWIRILSQTEHNQRLILNPSWGGATKDVQDMENDVILMQQQVERRAAEEERRKEEARRRAEDEERQRQAGTSVRGSRGRGRGVGRGIRRGVAAGSGSVGSAGSEGGSRGGSQAPGRVSSGIGRGLGGTRSRGGRGLR